MREKYDQKVIEFTAEISRLQTIIEQKIQEVNELREKLNGVPPQRHPLSPLSLEVMSTSADGVAEVESLKNQLRNLQLQLQNSTRHSENLQKQIDSSLQTIRTLSEQIQWMKRSYNEVVEDIAEVDLRVQGLQNKYNEKMMNELEEKTYRQDPWVKQSQERVR